MDKKQEQAREELREALWRKAFPNASQGNEWKLLTSYENQPFINQSNAISNDKDLQALILKVIGDEPLGKVGLVRTPEGHVTMPKHIYKHLKALDETECGCLNERVEPAPCPECGGTKTTIEHFGGWSLVCPTCKGSGKK